MGEKLQFWFIAPHGGSSLAMMGPKSGQESDNREPFLGFHEFLNHESNSPRIGTH
jgi:hypothetical protein